MVNHGLRYDVWALYDEFEYNERFCIFHWYERLGVGIGPGLLSSLDEVFGSGWAYILSSLSRGDGVASLSPKCGVNLSLRRNFSLTVSIASVVRLFPINTEALEFVSF